VRQFRNPPDQLEKAVAENDAEKWKQVAHLPAPRLNGGKRRFVRSSPIGHLTGELLKGVRKLAGTFAFVERLIERTKEIYSLLARNVCIL
jgi:hypothetical protein